MVIMARYSAQHKRETRARILDAAEGLIKDRGADAATVEAVMRAAGLTVGGFYAHFASKEALARETLIVAVEKSFARLTAGLDELEPRAFAAALIRRYLAQLDDPGLAQACPMTVALPEIARSDDAFRSEFTARTAALVAQIEHRLPAVAGMAPRDVALATLSALAGGVGFARAAGSVRARKRIAAATAAALARLLDLDDGVAPRAVRSRRAT